MRTCTHTHTRTAMICVKKTFSPSVSNLFWPQTVRQNKTFSVHKSQDWGQNTVIAWKEYRPGIFCLPSAIYGSFEYAILFHLMHSPSTPFCHHCELTQGSWLTIKKNSEKGVSVIVQELCESQGSRPGLFVLTSLLVSVDVKLYWTMLRHSSQLVPNMSTDIWGQ